MPNHSSSFVVRCSLFVRRTTNHEPRTTRRGFTLLEVLIATVIFTVGILSVMWAFNMGIFASGDVEDVDLALNIAQAKMEEVKNTAFASLVDVAATPDANFSRFSTTVDVAEGQNPKQVDVTVNWDVKGGQTGFTLTTLIADYSTQ